MTQKRKHRENRGRRWAAACLTVLFAAVFCTGFTFHDGFGNVHYHSSKELFRNLSYGEIIGGQNGLNQHAYVVQGTTGENGLQVLVFNGEVRGAYTVGQMIRYAEQQGYKVVAAINGDIFDTSSGTPKGLTIHNGNIVTSGYGPDRSLAFDRNGKASLQKVNLSYGLKGFFNDAAVPPGTPPPADGSLAVVPREFNTLIQFINVPQGGAKGLHLYNRHYGPSTRTGGACTEVVIETATTEDVQLKINGTINGKVKSVTLGTNNTPIGPGQLVLSAVSDSASAPLLSNMTVGSDVEISVTDNEGAGLADAVEAVGIYYSIVKDGRVDTTGTNINPRTAVGIKPDGSLVLYVLDGRQPAVSSGLGLIDTAKHMIALGCTEAFNMDGGGSSVLYARLPGTDSQAVLKSSPAQASERKVANSILLAYRETADSSARNIHIYPMLSLALPGADVQLTASASNDLYEKTALPGPVTWLVEEGGGAVNGSGLYTAGDTPGRVLVGGEAAGIRGRTEIEIVSPKDVTLVPSVSRLSLDPGQTADINIAARAGAVAVASKDRNFVWSCDEGLGTVDADGKFTAGGKNGLKGNLYVQAQDGPRLTIPVAVGKEILDFSDTTGHWARTYIGKLAAQGVVNGVGSNMFMPDAPLTRAQFLAMLAKTVNNPDLAAAPPAGFTDVPAGEWYYNYVNWGFSKGIVSGTGEKTFAPNAGITREQMAIMLCNFAKMNQNPLAQKTRGVAFKDGGAISPWAADYVMTVVGAGIMGGDDKGFFRPQGSATRAEAAKVTYMYLQDESGITGGTATGAGVEKAGEETQKTTGGETAGEGSGNGP